MSSNVPGRRPRRTPRNQHKISQICAQVERALALTLSGECTDPTLNGLAVESVSPAPDASRLLVRVLSPIQSSQDVVDVYEALARAKGLLRSEVAAELNRKRTPELAFVVIPEEEPSECRGMYS